MLKKVVADVVFDDLEKGNGHGRTCEENFGAGVETVVDDDLDFCDFCGDGQEEEDARVGMVHVVVDDDAGFLGLGMDETDEGVSLRIVPESGSVGEYFAGDGLDVVNEGWC